MLAGISRSVFLIEIHIFNDSSGRIWLLFQKRADLDLHFLLRQGMTCSAREGLTVASINPLKKTELHLVRATALITKTCLYNADPLKHHFYIVKLGFTGAYIIFLISANKHRLWVLVRTA